MRWQEKKDARTPLRTTPNDSSRRSLEVVTNQLKRATAEGLRRSFELPFSQLEGRNREGDQFGFYEHLKGVGMEGERTFFRSTSRTRKVDCCGALASSGSAGYGGFTKCYTPSCRPLTRLSWTSSRHGPRACHWATSRLGTR